MGNLKAKGYRAEEVVQQRYEQRGYTLLHKNWTIPGGEIDLIMKKRGELVFVEVKLVDRTRDLENYVSARKLQVLERSIERYCAELDEEWELRLDVVFVQWGSIVAVFENVSNG